MGERLQHHPSGSGHKFSPLEGAGALLLLTTSRAWHLRAQSPSEICSRSAHPREAQACCAYSGLAAPSATTNWGKETTPEDTLGLKWVLMILHEVQGQLVPAANRRISTKLVTIKGTDLSPAGLHTFLACCPVSDRLLEPLRAPVRTLNFIGKSSPPVPSLGRTSQDSLKTLKPDFTDCSFPSQSNYLGLL